MTFSRTRCAHCRQKFESKRPGQIVHEECAADYVIALREKEERKAEKQARMQARVERAETRRKREKSLTLSQRKARAQVQVNAYVRLRDADLPCISCGRFHQGQWHAGHYRSRGAASNLALDPRNIHKQCQPCNNHLHGNAIAYRAGLIERYGVEYVEALESDNDSRHLTAEEVDAIRDEYRAKTNQLKKERA